MLGGWLKRLPPKDPPKEFQQLPRPFESSNPDETAKTNAVVQAALTNEAFTKKKRGPYCTKYTPEFKHEVAAYACQNGLTRAAEKFSKELDRKINTSTIDEWKKMHIKAMKTTGMAPDTSDFESKKRGQPFLLGATLDSRVQQYVRATRISGGIINRTLLTAAARGIVISTDRSQLKEHGGPIELTRGWANSILNRMNMVKRRGTKAARKLPVDFEEIKEKFLSAIAAICREHSIPIELVLNWDQTGLFIIPKSEWTLDEKGTKQVLKFKIWSVSLVSDDKRQITGLIALSAVLDIVPPQLIYEGTTAQCHPKGVLFPEDWHIHHSPSHWSTGDTMMEYLNEVIVPYFKRKRAELGLSPDQKGLVLFDVYKAHQKKELFQVLEANNLEFRFVPASCTSELQPLDADGGINFSLKEILKNKFSVWYAEQVASALDKGVDISEVKVDVRLSVMKPIHANWLIGAFDEIRQKEGVLMAGWKKTGIYDVLQECCTPLEELRQSTSGENAEEQFESELHEDSEVNNEDQIVSLSDDEEVETADATETEATMGNSFAQQNFEQNSSFRLMNTSLPESSCKSQRVKPKQHSKGVTGKKPRKPRVPSFDQRVEASLRKERKKEAKLRKRLGVSEEELSLFERFGPPGP